MFREDAVMHNASSALLRAWGSQSSLMSRKSQESLTMSLLPPSFSQPLEDDVGLSLGIWQGGVLVYSQRPERDGSTPATHERLDLTLGIESP